VGRESKVAGAPFKGRLGLSAQWGRVSVCHKKRSGSEQGRGKIGEVHRLLGEGRENSKSSRLLISLAREIDRLRG